MFVGGSSVVAVFEVGGFGTGKKSREDCCVLMLRPRWCRNISFNFVRFVFHFFPFNRCFFARSSRLPQDSHAYKRHYKSFIQITRFFVNVVHNEKI